MQIYLLRHGQTDWNNLFLIQGRTNNILNEQGRKEALEASIFFKNISPTKLISSPLVRARQTLEIVKEQNGWNLEILENDLFIERDFGELEKSNALVYREIEDFSGYVKYETDETLEKRIKKGIDRIIEENLEEDIVIVTCHSHVMKAFLVSLGNEKNKCIKYTYKTRLKNCAIIQVDVKEKQINEIIVK